MKRVLYFILLFSLHSASAKDPSGYVDPMIGTGGVGHTFPGATVPFGMVQLSPDTRVDGSWEGCAGYYHNDSLIYGFSHTHLSGTGCSDYGDILVLPGSGEFSFDPGKYAVKRDRKSEKASPGFYSVKLEKSGIQCELTATMRTGMQRFTFPSGSEPNVLVDLVHRDKVLASSLRIVNDHMIQGFRRSEAWAKDQWIFFTMEFSRPFTKILAEGNGEPLQPGDSLSGTLIRVVMLFNDSSQELMVKTGVSTVDYEGSIANLKNENPGWNFDEVVSNARRAWNLELGKIKAEGGSDRSLTNFYTALYHAMVVPNVMSDVDGRYRGRDNKIHRADGYTHYSVFSLWDTFRAAHPLYALIDKKRTLDFIRTFISQYEQGGLLPVWELASNETDCMIGFHSVSVIADAIDKGVTGFNILQAYEAMKASANSGQRGLDVFNKNYYLQIDDESESVSKSLEYAYDNWCISRVSHYLGRKEDAALYETRAAAYINMYDSQTGFMRPRRNGNWYSPFDPREVNNHYTEANSYQYSFFVPQDIPGMIRLLGGAEEFEKKLDGLFNASQSTTGRTQADITGLIGQYAHGNEPSHHMAYLYDYIGKPWKTQQIIHRIRDSLYVPTADGLPGNEDCGQMSAWYVWSALGFYPVSPGNSFYALGTPLFDKVTVSLENGKKIIISSSGTAPGDYFVKSWMINGLSQKGNLLNYASIKDGAEIKFSLASQPFKERGNTPELLDEMDKSNFLPAPLVLSASRHFDDSLCISFSSEQGVSIRFSTGNKPDDFQIYKNPFYIHSTSTISAYAEKGSVRSGKSTATFYKYKHPYWKVHLKSTPNRQYSAEGPVSLIDGVYGSEDWRKGEWHGFQGQNLIIEMKFNNEEELQKVIPGFLQDTRSWIVFPKNIIVEVSSDGKEWTKVADYTFTVPVSDLNVQILRPEIKLNGVKASSVRFKADYFGQLPSWHPGAGGEAFIFCDEIDFVSQ